MKVVSTNITQIHISELISQRIKLLSAFCHTHTRNTRTHTNAHERKNDEKECAPTKDKEPTLLLLHTMTPATCSLRSSVSRLLDKRPKAASEVSAKLQSTRTYVLTPSLTFPATEPALSTPSAVTPKGTMSHLRQRRPGHSPSRRYCCRRCTPGASCPWRCATRAPSSQCHTTPPHMTTV